MTDLQRKLAVNQPKLDSGKTPVQKKTLKKLEKEKANDAESDSISERPRDEKI